jgi:hypothetical protein
VVPAVVVTVSVELPEPVTAAGLKLAFAPAGRPVTLKATLPEKPLAPLTLTL